MGESAGTPVGAAGYRPGRRVQRNSGSGSSLRIMRSTCGAGWKSASQDSVAGTGS